MGSYETLSDTALIAAKRDLEAELGFVKEKIRVVAAEQERRAAKAKVDSMSPAERDYLKQSIGAEGIKSTAKVHST